MYKPPLPKGRGTAPAVEGYKPLPIRTHYCYAVTLGTKLCLVEGYKNAECRMKNAKLTLKTASRFYSLTYDLKILTEKPPFCGFSSFLRQTGIYIE